jgi:hypothetical protein
VADYCADCDFTYDLGQASLAETLISSTLPVISSVQQRQQRAKLYLVATRAVRHFGHGITVNRRPCHSHRRSGTTS